MHARVRLFLALAPAVAAASLHLSNVFGSNMVLQRGQPINIWGWSSAGAAISGSLGAAPASATADATGFFKLTFPALPASFTPTAVSVSDGTSSVSLTNVLIGDVILCSGQ